MSICHPSTARVASALSPDTFLQSRTLRQRVTHRKALRRTIRHLLVWDQRPMVYPSPFLVELRQAWRRWEDIGAQEWALWRRRQSCKDKR
jgi:hypothetical protein